MKEISYQIKDELGLHARPAAFLVKAAGKYKCKITISKENKTTDAKSILGVMGLGAKKGEVVKLVFNGVDEVAAAVELEAFLKENL